MADHNLFIALQAAHDIANDIVRPHELPPDEPWLFPAFVGQKAACAIWAAEAVAAMREQAVL